MRYSHPNENGVFEDHECVDRITHTTTSGAWVEIRLAYTAQGWASALGFRLHEYGSHSPVSSDGPWHQTHDDAVDAQIKKLKASCIEKIKHWHTSERRKAECHELLDWAETQRQANLF